jgi:Rap1a immunity proteins
MNPSLFIPVIALVTSMTLNSNAQANSIELIEACQSYVSVESPKYDEAVKGSHCFSYLAGFIDGWTTLQAKTEVKAGNVCFPRDVSYFQLAAVYAGWAEKHPESWHLDNWNTVSISFAEAFPCK